MEIGKTILSLRKEKGLSQVKLAKRAGLTQAYISKLELGKEGEPSLTALNKICDVLEVSLLFLLYSSIEEEDIKKDELDDFRKIDPLLRRILQK